MNAGLLPVKRLDRAKARLGPHFDEAQRSAIARALLDDALDLCRASRRLQWWVVTDDPAAVDGARGRGLDVLRDDGRGLNQALMHAMASVAREGASSVTIVPADVPLTCEEDLDDVLDTGATSDVVVVPARRDGGTNALHMRPPGLLAPRFGASSLSAHVAAAQRLALRCSILPLPRLALDIDTSADVRDFIAADGRRDGHTARVLDRIGRGDERAGS
ncbi:2-phospho-L-lactate guanylyltransferase [soil metagenome]